MALGARFLIVALSVAWATATISRSIVSSFLGVTSLAALAALLNLGGNPPIIKTANTRDLAAFSRSVAAA
jgi:hypothetical protein